MNITYGTAHFVSVQAAQRYYSAMGYDRLTVNDKLVNGEIFAFPPAIPKGERLVLLNDGQRYGLQVRS